MLVTILHYKGMLCTINYGKCNRQKLRCSVFGPSHNYTVHVFID